MCGFVFYRVKRGNKVLATFWFMDDAREYAKEHRAKIYVVKGKYYDA